MKACTQCGRTGTPQWREGPAGPKTLCNACGVKHTRQKQKGIEEKPAKVAPALHQARNLAAAVPAIDNLQDHKSVPVRSARKRVARTHDDGYLYGDNAYDELPRPTLKRMRSSHTNDSEPTDSGGEEIAWTLSTDMITQEVNAAVDLLAMSLPAEVVAQAQSLDVLECLKAAEVKTNAAFAPTQLKDELARYGLDFESLPAEKVEVLMDAWIEVEKTRKEASVACDAVATVAQILAVKEAASIQAKSTAFLAARHLSRLLSTLDSETAPEVPTAGAVPRRRRTTGKAKLAQLPELKEAQGISQDVEMVPVEQTLL